MILSVTLYFPLVKEGCDFVVCRLFLPHLLLLQLLNSIAVDCFSLVDELRCILACYYDVFICCCQCLSLTES